ncbi:MAG TPA: methylmalonyl-CoA epimerase [Anaerolineales bacterium]|nr:methylmalonyl-CoA epimerase [Anaerolineales bacterium]
MSRITKINHIALAVTDIENSLSFWRDALGLELAEQRDVPLESAQIAFLPLGGTEIELVRPTDDDSGLAKYIEKRGEGMHHLCLETDDIDGMMAQLKEKGVQLINESPRIGEDGKKYAFLHPKSTGGVLVELYEVRVA